jgi:hypothetical protein
MLHAPAATHDVQLLADLRDAAERTIELHSTLDTTTAGAVAIDAELPRLELAEIDENDLIGFVVASARIERLRRRVEQTLASLEHQGGTGAFEELAVACLGALRSLPPRNRPTGGDQQRRSKKSLYKQAAIAGGSVCAGRRQSVTADGHLGTGAGPQGRPAAGPHPS